MTLLDRLPPGRYHYIMETPRVILGFFFRRHRPHGRVRPRRSLRPLSCLLFPLLTIGCIQVTSAPRPPATPTLLDNHGGFSHAGRRIALGPDGRYTDTTYSDNPGSDRATRGLYSLDAAGSHLTLSPEGAPAEHLYRVDYHRRQYWVHDQDRPRIAQPGESELRRVSLRAATR
ncbi:MAG: hypothetical protein NTV86_08380 [Planctomycetota bacterium]|nr:hypothetical protein [Planctomycetota bacterium]